MRNPRGLNGVFFAVKIIEVRFSSHVWLAKKYQLVPVNNPIPQWNHRAVSVKIQFSHRTWSGFFLQLSRHKWCWNVTAEGQWETDEMCLIHTEDLGIKHHGTQRPIKTLVGGVNSWTAVDMRKLEEAEEAEEQWLHKFSCFNREE